MNPDDSTRQHIQCEVETAETTIGKFSLNNLFLGDSLLMMKSLPRECVDLIVCDGPYGTTQNEWDRIPSIQDFNLELIKMFSSILKPGGAAYLFGKSDCIDFIDYRLHLMLNTKIIWYQPSRLAQGRLNFTNNYDIIAYFTKGRAKTFNLDDIRVPQLVELEHRKRCEQVPSVTNGRFGKTRFHPDGKNPGDVWGDIKQLTYKSKELLDRDLLNTIQKPKKLVERIIRASSCPGDVVLDPFAGTGTSLVVSRELDRKFLGFENDPRLFSLATDRLATLERDLKLSLFGSTL